MTDSMSDPEEENPWEAIRRYMEDGAEVIFEVSSSAGPRLVDCTDCDAIHPVGECFDDDEGAVAVGDDLRRTHDALKGSLLLMQERHAAIERGLDDLLERLRKAQERVDRIEAERDRLRGAAERVQLAWVEAEAWGFDDLEELRAAIEALS